jgi:hypothetical protein
LSYITCTAFGAIPRTEGRHRGRDLRVPRPAHSQGRLEVTGISPTSAADELRLIFEPTNRTDGIDLSADPIPLARSAVYAISYDRRSMGE